MANKERIRVVRKLPDNLNPKLESLRCQGTWNGRPCNRFLGYYALVEGTIAIKCRRCKGFTILDVRQVDAKEEKG